MCQRRWAHAAAGKERERFTLLRQHLAWQCEIDRTARFRHRHRERAVDHRLELVEVAKFVVPLGPLARDASLVEGSPWSKDSCAQWMWILREPCNPFSVSGVRPAVKIIGTLAREEFIIAASRLAVPT